MRPLDPVAAYDRIAPEFAALSNRRRAYLDGIDQLVIAEIPPGKRSLLDVGAGDGTRAWRIAQAKKLDRLTLLEPSEAMRRTWPIEAQAWAMRAEELSGQHFEFDVITCLWNVLGHIFPAQSRANVLRDFARLLAPGGLIFIDISHRYNSRHYGLLPSIFRLIRDRVLPRETNGDVVARWNVNGIECATNGHVFTHSEFSSLCHAAGLTIKKRFVVDYATGEVRQSIFSGNFFYVLQQSAEHTPHA